MTADKNEVGTCQCVRMIQSKRYLFKIHDDEIIYMSILQIMLNIQVLSCLKQLLYIRIRYCQLL